MAKKYRRFFLLIFITFGCCYFLIFIALSPNLPNQYQPICLYSNQCQNNIKNIFIQAMEKAHDSIYIVMFGITDAKILSTLNDKSQKLRKMDIFYDPKASVPLHKILSYAQTTPIKKSGYMHQKILIVDDKTVYLGSTNLTSSSLSMHDNFLIGIHNHSLAHFLKKKTPLGSGFFQHYFDHQSFRLWLLPDKTDQALEDLIRLIHQASKKIQIAMFTFTHPKLVDALIYAKQKGVHVQVMIDSQSGYGCSMESIKKLKKQKIPVHLNSSIQLMHHKLMVIDENTLVTGSANWTQAAFKKNQDYYFILSPLTKDQKRFCQNLFKILETELTNPDFLE